MITSTPTPKKFDPDTALLVMIQWVDSSSKSGRWTLVEELMDEALRGRSLGLITTVGWIVIETDEQVIIAATLSRHSDDVMDAGEIMAIPLSCIKRRKVLSKGVPWLLPKP